AVTSHHTQMLFRRDTRVNLHRSLGLLQRRKRFFQHLVKLVEERRLKISRRATTKVNLRGRKRSRQRSHMANYRSQPTHQSTDIIVSRRIIFRNNELRAGAIMAEFFAKWDVDIERNRLFHVPELSEHFSIRGLLEVLRPSGDTGI